MRGVRAGTHTGWFGRYRLTDRPRYAQWFATVTHAVEDGRPVCGVVLYPDMEFQWCASGIHRESLECRNCKRVLHARIGR